MKSSIQLFAVAAVVLGTAGRAPAVTAPAALTAPQPPLPVTVAPGPVQSPARPLPVAVAPATQAAADANSGVLDLRRQFALGMIETGNDDREIGGCGEVSRYQILPSVWRHYSTSLNYHDPQVSREVASRHWAALYNAFKQHAHREPTDFDMYVLWNTHYGYYSCRHFDPARLAPIVRDRAQRYANLVRR